MRTSVTKPLENELCRNLLLLRINNLKRFFRHVTFDLYRTDKKLVLLLAQSKKIINSTENSMIFTISFFATLSEHQKSNNTTLPKIYKLDDYLCRNFVHSHKSKNKKLSKI